MARYHINPETGNPNKCGAVKGNCPFGGTNEHYDTKAEAQAAYETHMDQTTDALQSIQKEIRERREARRADKPGLEIVNTATGQVEAFIGFNKDELSMPGYVDHVMKNYEGTQWTVRKKNFAEDQDPTVAAAAAKLEAARAALANRPEDTEEIKALKEELKKAEAAPRNYGFAEDEMTRYYQDQREKELREKIKALDPTFDPQAEKRLQAAEESFAIAEANAKILAQHPYTPAPRHSLPTGTVKYDDVVIAEIQTNTEFPGTAPRTYEQFGRKRFIVPNVTRLTTAKKAAIADELYMASGRPLETWVTAHPETKAQWAERYLGKHGAMEFTNHGDGKVSWSTRSSVSSNYDANDVAILDL